MTKIFKIAILILILLVLFAVGWGIYKYQGKQKTGEINPAQGKTISDPEADYIKGLAGNAPDGEKYAAELLSALNDLRDVNSENDLQAYLKMGVNFNLLGEKQKAIENYEKALAITPKNYLALNNLANIYNDLGDYKKAESYFLKMIEYYPQETVAYRSLGYLYRYRLNKKPSEIENFFKQGLEKTNNNPDLLSWLITYFQEIGDNRKFVEYANLLIKKQKAQ